MLFEFETAETHKTQTNRIIKWVLGGVVLLLFLLVGIPPLHKYVTENGRPLVCYACSAVKNSTGSWSSGACQPNQKWKSTFAEKEGCTKNATSCGILYFNIYEAGELSVSRIQRKCLYGDGFDSAVYPLNNGPGDSTSFVFFGTSIGRKFEYPFNRSVTIEAWEQKCNTPYCNSWSDYKRPWSQSQWVKEAYRSFYTPSYYNYTKV